MRNNRRSIWALFSRDTEDKTKRMARRPLETDLSEAYVANSELLNGLFRGTNPELSLASALAFVPITKPVNMMGLPTPYSDDPLTQATLDEIVDTMSANIPNTHRDSLLLGTSWIFPRYDSEEDKLVWEQIKDYNIHPILLSPRTLKAVSMISEEQLKAYFREEMTSIVTRKRTFYEDKYEEKWSGEQGIKSITYRNIGKTLPISFPNEADIGKYRGYSILARVITDYRNYARIEKQRADTLAKFRPKQVQTSYDPDEWLAQNGIQPEEFSTYDFAGIDFIVNKISDKTKEETKFEFLPQGATEAYGTALQNTFWKIVEGTPVPELFWGPLATGNHATTTEQMQDAVSYMDSLRRQWNTPYYRAFSASLRILSIARNESYSNFKVRWNKLDALSQDTKSSIFLRFSQAIKNLSSSGMITPAQVYKLWQLNYPEVAFEKYEEWLANTEETVRITKTLGSSGQEPLKEEKDKQAGEAQ